MTNALGCVSVSEPYEICLPGTSSAVGSNVVALGNDVTLEVMASV